MRMAVLWVALIACSSKAPPGAATSPPAGPAAIAEPAPPDAAPTATCAPTLMEFPAGQRCLAGSTPCAYGATTCACKRVNRCGGMPVSPEEVAATYWQCAPPRADGCPLDPPAGACTQNGQFCGDYVVDCCTVMFECAANEWKTHERNCTPRP